MVGYIGQTRYPKTKVVHLGEGHLKKIERLKGAILQFRPAFMDFKNIKAVDLRNTFANLRSKKSTKNYYCPSLLVLSMRVCITSLEYIWKQRKKTSFFNLNQKIVITLKAII